MSKGKGIAAEVGETVGTAAAEVSLEFNPPASAIKDDDNLKVYLGYYNGRIGDDIQVALAPRQVDYTQAPREEGGVYIATLVLALDVHLPLSDFVREVLVYYHLAPIQLAPGS